VTDPSGANVPVTITGGTNQTVTLPVGTIIFNERIAGPGALTTNAAHMNVTVGGTNYNVILASAYSDIVCPGIIITAAEVNISGHVVDANGFGISRATVVISNAQNQLIRSTTSDDNGAYTLTGIQTGSTYIVNASSRAYLFAPRSINLLDEVTGFNLTGTPR